MASFDIVSEIDIQEMDNAVNQARKEIGSRYDFKGSKSEIKWDRKVITILADDNEYKLNAIKDILQSKVHKRGLDMRVLKFEEPSQAGGMMWKQTVNLVQGLDKEHAKKVVKIIKDSKIKVQPAIQGDLVRVSSKSFDNLQECIALVKNSDFELPVQFVNMR
jgi:hypothetical protein